MTAGPSVRILGRRYRVVPPSMRDPRMQLACTIWARRSVKALGARRAMVLGQVFPGQVSVWKLFGETVDPRLRYVVFPGNVGDREALSKTLDRLGGER